MTATSFAGDSCGRISAKTARIRRRSLLRTTARLLTLVLITIPQRLAGCSLLTKARRAKRPAYDCREAKIRSNSRVRRIRPDLGNIRLGSQFLASFGHAALNDLSAAIGQHALTEAMLALSALNIRLVRSLRHISMISMIKGDDDTLFTVSLLRFPVNGGIASGVINRLLTL